MADDDLSRLTQDEKTAEPKKYDPMLADILLTDKPLEDIHREHRARERAAELDEIPQVKLTLEYLAKTAAEPERASCS
jgi:hypothetical protein